MTVKVIGDLIEFQGQCVARLSPGLTASRREDFRDLIESAVVEEDDDDLIDRIEEASKLKGGLLSFEEIKSIILRDAGKNK